jgi:hypothetical protein
MGATPDKKTTEDTGQISRRAFGLSLAATTSSLAANPFATLESVATTGATSAAQMIAPGVFNFFHQLVEATGAIQIELSIRKASECGSRGPASITADEQVEKLWKVVEAAAKEHLSKKGCLARTITEMQTRGIEAEVRTTLFDLSSRIAKFRAEVSKDLMPAIIELFEMRPEAIPNECNERLKEIKRLKPNIIDLLKKDALGPLLIDEQGKPSDLSSLIHDLEGMLYGAKWIGGPIRNMGFTTEGASRIKSAIEKFQAMVKLYFSADQIPLRTIEELHSLFTDHTCDWRPKSGSSLSPELLTPEGIAQRAMQDINALPDIVKEFLTKNPSILQAIPSAQRQGVIDTLWQKCTHSLPRIIEQERKSHSREPVQSERALDVNVGWPENWSEYRYGGNDFY